MYKGVIKWIYVCCNKCSSPIYLKFFKSSIPSSGNYTKIISIYLTWRPIDFKSCTASGGKYSNQYAASANFLISSFCKPRVCMICHWYLAAPALATALLWNKYQSFSIFLKIFVLRLTEFFLPFSLCSCPLAHHLLFLLFQFLPETAVDNHKFPFLSSIYRHMP